MIQRNNLLAALIFFCLPAFLFSAELKVQFIGNAAFQITDGKTTLLSDYPYRSGAFGYMNYDFSKVQPAGKTLCLITHGHADHFEPSLFEKSNCKIIAPEDVTKKLDPTRVVSTSFEVRAGLRPDPTFQFSDISIEAIETPHAKIGHYSYLVIWHGKRLYFTGDTESTDALLLAQKLDVAFVTPWLLSSVLKTDKQMDATKILIYHHTVDEKIPSCEKCMTLRQGESLVLQ